MTFQAIRSKYFAAAIFLCLLAGFTVPPAHSQSSRSQSSSSNPQADQSSSSAAYVHERTPSLVDPAGPTISLTSTEPVFVMAAALNMSWTASAAELRSLIRPRSTMRKPVGANEDP